MNGRILRRKGEARSAIEMDQSERDRIACLGHVSQKILTSEYRDLWQQADGPDILAQLESSFEFAQFGNCVKKAHGLDVLTETKSIFA